MSPCIAPFQHLGELQCFSRGKAQIMNLEGENWSNKSTSASLCQLQALSEKTNGTSQVRGAMGRNIHLIQPRLRAACWANHLVCCRRIIIYKNSAVLWQKGSLSELVCFQVACCVSGSALCSSKASCHLKMVLTQPLPQNTTTKEQR